MTHSVFEHLTSLNRNVDSAIMHLSENIAAAPRDLLIDFLSHITPERQFIGSFNCSVLLLHLQ
jgi:hypothetical protein